MSVLYMKAELLLIFPHTKEVKKADSPNDVNFADHVVLELHHSATPSN